MIVILLCCPVGATAQKHTQFLGISLGESPLEVVQQLRDKGFQQEDTLELSGRVAGLRVWVYVSCNKDSSRVNHILLTTQEEQNSSYREDYGLLMRWMQRNYGAPSWHSTVRSHPFARWFVDFDHDIVMIATAKKAVEIYFYDNHERRNIDYYAILKYCERNPVDTAPHFTASESVTWKSSTPPAARKMLTKQQLRRAKAAKRKGKARKTTSRKTSSKKAKSHKAKSSKRHRK